MSLAPLSLSLIIIHTVYMRSQNKSALGVSKRDGRIVAIKESLGATIAVVVARTAVTLLCGIIKFDI